MALTPAHRNEPSPSTTPSQSKYLPDWGIGAVTHHFEVSGLFRVEFEVDGRICASEFHPGELQHARATVSRLA